MPQSSIHEVRVGLLGADRPRVCFVPTASGDSDRYVAGFYRRFARSDCRPADLSLFRREVEDLTDFACSQDVIYVGGGNTANMLAIWKAHGFDDALRAAMEAGVVLAGLSAGSICWFEQGVTDSFGGDLQALECLGFLPGSHCPHYDSEAQRRPMYHELIGKGLAQGWAADDSAALHFLNGQLLRVVTSRREAGAYRVSLRGRDVQESPLQTEYLGDGGR